MTNIKYPEDSSEYKWFKMDASTSSNVNYAAHLERLTDSIHKMMGSSVEKEFFEALHMQKPEPLSNPFMDDIEKIHDDIIEKKQKLRGIMGDLAEFDEPKEPKVSDKEEKEFIFDPEALDI